MRKDLVYVMLGSALPAVSNFVAVVFALKYLDAAWLGRSYALLALFFVSIDVFNFGSARLYSVTKIRERFPSLLFLDTVSATGSALFFSIAAWIMSASGAIALPQILPMLVIAPVGYATSHFALGYLRLKGGNAAICAVSTVSALCRCSVIWLIATHPSWSLYLPDLLLLVEGSYGTMLLGAYLTVRTPEPAAPAGPAALRHLVGLGGKELISSWYSNAIFSGAKHLDVIIAAMLLGPAGAALYRGAKSVHNLAFNFGQALALVLHSRMLAWLRALRRHLSKMSVFGVAIAICALLTFGAFLAFKIRLFPTASLGSPSRQCLFLFLIFLGASLMFACRLISITVFSISKRTFVILSTMEVGVSLALLSCLCLIFGVVGAALSVVVSCGSVLLASLVVVQRSAHAIRVD
ncbi:hypothetical protein PAMC26510_04935 [Caballeronia sordidicola]|uniref:O-antigen/teichoic acid export membrane protein n=2 Tax=Caballeronia sordidicola TaxID=196367 RepID=A0A242N856_CABSO|nr:hypothetical protein PAMC26510_04935 [Caballeronia sordidicola]